MGAVPNYLWHPFTQMREYQSLVIEEGKGSWIKDTRGNWFLDGVSSLWVNVHGHCHPLIDMAVKGQLKKISHTTLLGLGNVPAIELAEELISISPAGLKRVFYSDSGSEACEIALKIAFQYWQQCRHPQKKKTKFIHLDLSYHGDTFGAMSVGGIELFHNIYKPLLNKTISVPSPYCYRCPFNRNEKTCGKECLEELERVIRKNHKETAALIMEPLIQAASGMITHPEGYLREVQKLTQKYNILLILDEVATGFGRTGTMFACQKEGVSPDIMTIAKGLTGGYLPLAATLTTEKIYNAFLGAYAQKKTFFHGHTYTGNPLACRAALASLSIFKKERTLEKLKAKIDLMKELLLSFKSLEPIRRIRGVRGHNLMPLKGGNETPIDWCFMSEATTRRSGHPTERWVSPIEGNEERKATNLLEHAGDIRQCGFMAGIELVKNKETKEEYRWEEKIGIKVCLRAREKNIIIRPLGNVIVLMPPLSIKKWELEKLIHGIYESIKEVA